MVRELGANERPSAQERARLRSLSHVAVCGADPADAERVTLQASEKSEARGGSKSHRGAGWADRVALWHSVPSPHLWEHLQETVFCPTPQHFRHVPRARAARHGRAGLELSSPALPAAPHSRGTQLGRLGALGLSPAAPSASNCGCTEITEGRHFSLSSSPDPSCLLALAKKEVPILKSVDRGRSLNSSKRCPLSTGQTPARGKHRLQTRHPAPSERPCVPERARWRVHCGVSSPTQAKRSERRHERGMFWGTVGRRRRRGPRGTGRAGSAGLAVRPAGCGARSESHAPLSSVFSLVRRGAWTAASKSPSVRKFS